MMKLSHSKLIFISGLVWLAIGLFLLPLGMRLLLGAAFAIAVPTPLLTPLAPLVGGAQQAALFIVVIGLLIGYTKGRFVLAKSVRRSIARILTFSNPTSIANLYSRGYYMLMALMICMGMAIKWFGLPDDVRGLIDVAVGAALIQGAMLYFRLAVAMRQLQP